MEPHAHHSFLSTASSASSMASSAAAASTHYSRRNPPPPPASASMMQPPPPQPPAPQPWTHAAEERVVRLLEELRGHMLGPHRGSISSVEDERAMKVRRRVVE